MSRDQEPIPSGENTPPFLTIDQLEQVRSSFTFEDFNIVTPSTGEPYLVITVPKKISPLVDHALKRAKEVAFNTVKEAGSNTFQDPDFSEDEQADLREVWSELYLPTLQAANTMLLYSTLSHILLFARNGAEINAFERVKTSSRQDFDLAYGEVRKKRDAIGDLMFKRNRYMVYNGEEVIYKTPADLENPYPPSYLGRQN